ncbi:hypothetical protein UMM65_12705 [Aureibaculum sp. 2210JD6-5]|uniref:hypothetical protein n=1 Tax=Aureibaculum sp. 2210JD6-5 TaxID=3103957 RepID=UPI002AAF060E|nr:hypothetical protein [Aureibaculum sp. 2210JD6-5]MDY7396103.1 hypothetical protein [Aureibaculum sp. 2210JD6-5]
MNAVKNMNKYSLIKELNTIPNTNRESLKKLSKLILTDQSLFESLVEISFDYDNDISLKAIATLELVVEQRLDWIAYNLSYFTKNISRVKDENAIKSLSKICDFIAQEYTSKFDSPIKLILTYDQLSEIIETCFDWLLNDYKASIKTNAMDALYHIGNKIGWIHYEMKLIIDKNISNESASYASKAKKVLEMIEKTSMA